MRLNTSTLEWLESRSMDGKELSPEERSARGWEVATSFGLLVLTGAGLKMPGTAKTAEQLAGRSLFARIMHSPIGGSMLRGARSSVGAMAGSRLAQAVLRNPRVVALQLRLAGLQERMAASAGQAGFGTRARDLMRGRDGFADPGPPVYSLYDNWLLRRTPFSVV